ncbi:helicase SRCAP isoform X2 [Castor canadensis]
MVSDGMTGSNPVSPASSSSPASSGAGGISPQHITQDSSLDGPPGPPDGATVPPEGLSLSQAADLVNKGPKWEKSHAEIAEQAKHEAEIETRIAELRKEGFWSLKRLPKVPEPPRPKGHWDYLCEEMQWLSADFAQERRWKRGVARKVVRMVIRHHEEQRQKEERARREEQAKLRRIASAMAKDVRQFWSNVEKVVQFKQQSRLEEKRKKALDLHLDFIVGQTEKYSDLLSQSLNQPLASSKAGSSPCLGSSSAASSPPPVASRLDDEDGDFQPQEEEEEDDEETIEVEEQQEGNDAETQRREIELLRHEGELPLEELLRSLPPQLLGGPSSPSQTPSSHDSDTRDEPEESVEEEPSQVLEVKPAPSSITQCSKQRWHPDEDDEEFTANDDEAEDEEDTIAAEEQLEGEVDHAMELSELAREGELSVEELLQQYAGAYASDASAPGSGSSDGEDEDEEVEANSSDCEQEEATEAEEAAQEDSSSQSDSAEEQSEDEEDDHSEEEETSGSSESEESESEESEDARSQSQADEEDEEEEDDDFGVEYLLARDEEQSEADGGSGPPTPGPTTTLGPKKEITDIAAAAESLQPKGYTLATTQVKTPIPLLLRGQLREYQHIGLDWLVTMYEKKLNGILADEMGLGKTIQTISLLAHLACEKGNWGPHLIIVPTSVMLNWEMELKRWCPSFKILTYYGAQKERKLKRQGWTKPNAFHVCITSYKLVLQDHQAFRRKNWRYLILDEAQNIKNFKSQRWQSLLNFNSQRRLLLTGTPLQNSLMELWSLMHFLMPHVFQSHREFKEWFSNPLTGMIEGSQEYNEGLVKRLHKVLRPFLLRRVKVDVEKQMPKKYEHVIRCRLSKRQRCLYDDFMAQTTTKETLATGHFMSVINILMQLRKVCNHPNLFDPRPVTSPFITPGICFSTASLVLRATDVHPLQRIDMGRFDLIGLEGRVSRYEADTFLPRHRLSRRVLLEVATAPDPPPRPKPVKMKVNRMLQPVSKQEGRTVVVVNSPRTPLGSGPFRPPLGPELSAQPTLSPTSPMLPAPLMMSASTAGPPLVPVSRPPGSVLLPPLQSNSGPLSQVLPSPLGVLSGTSQPPTPTLSLKPAPPAPVRLSPAPPPGSSSLLKPLTVPPGYTFSPAAAATTTSTTTATTTTTAVPAPAPAPQRLILSPEMQARLPSGEVVSIGQLASLAQRPVTSAGGSKPLTFQIQGNKLTLTGAQVRQLAVGQPRPLQRNVVHLVSAGGQHHLISQPAHVALIQAVAPTPGPTPVSVLPSSTPSTTPAPTGLSLPLAANQVPPSMVNNTGVVKIVVRQAPRDGLTPVPPLAPAPRPPSSGLPAVLTSRPTLTPGRLPTPTLGTARAPVPTPTLVRPLLKLVHSPAPEVSASTPGAAPMTISSSLHVPSSLPGPASSPMPIPNSSPLASPVSSTVSVPVSSSLPISVPTTLPTPTSVPLTIPISAPLPVSASGSALLTSVTPALVPAISAASGPPPLASAGPSPSVSALTLGLATAPALSPPQTPGHPLLLAPTSSHVPGLNSAVAPTCSPVLVPASALASPFPSAPNPAPAQASLLAPAPSASQALATSLAPLATPQTAILGPSPAPPLAPLPVLASSPGPAPVLAPSQTPLPIMAPSSMPGTPLASSSLVPSPTPVLTPSSTHTMVPAPIPSPLSSLASAQTLALAPTLASTLGGSSPSQTHSLGTGNPQGPFPTQTLSLTPASSLVPTPAQTLSLGPGAPLGPMQTLSLAPASPIGPVPAHTLTLAPASSSASLLATASVQALTLSPAPVSVPTLGPVAAQTLALAPASTQAPASQASSLVVSATGAASLPVTMTNRLPVAKDEPETLTLRSGPPSPPSTATSFSGPRPRRQPPPPPRSPFYLDSLEEKRKRQRSERLERIFQLSEAHGALAPVYGTEVLDFCTLPQPVASPIGPCSPGPRHPTFWTYTEAANQAVLFPQQRLDQLSEIIERFIFVMPPVEAPPPSLHACHPPPWLAPRQAAFQEQLACELWPRARPLHRIVCNMRTQFPDLRLIQYDCGKLQTLAVLLRQLKAEGHRVLIFTQMTRMLDVLEQFLTYHGHLYLRLDGSTRVEQRQALMERFNADKRIFCFILSTRSGGVGVNLTGADTVVFYDSDWNPTMDAQAQDRCHRIGQTRDVHIYRLISERTVEENILKKANQKRMLGDMAIEGGNFTTAYFKQQTIRELFDMPLEEPSGSSVPSAPEEEEETMASKQTHILEQALCRAEDEEDIRAATQAKAEQVAELAEFNENDGFPAGEGEEAGRPGAEDEEMSRAEQEIAALVEQLTPIERYAMKFLEASLEEVSREELKQAEEQVEAARKDLDQAKEEVFRLPQEEDEGPGAGDEMSCGTGGGSHRRSKKVKAPERPGTRVSERLRGARAETQGANHTPVTSTHHTRSTSTPPRCSPARERVPRPAPKPRPTPVSAPAAIPALVPVPVPVPIPISAPNPITILPVHILPSSPPPQIPPSCSSPACTPPPTCTPPPPHTPPPAQISLSTPSSPVLLGSPSVPVSPPVMTLPLGVGPEGVLCAQALASMESLELGGMNSSEASPLTLGSPKDLLPVAVEILPVSEKNFPLIPSAPSPILEAGSVPNGQEQKVPDCSEGPILTVLPDGELHTGLSESNGLELPPSASDEPLQESLEADRNLEELVEVQTPTSSPEKPQELVAAETTAPSTSSSATSSPEGSSPARPPRRRTSADVEIRGQGTGRPGQPPGPKVLRKLPGRLVTVVEEKELVRRRRHRGTTNTLVPGVSDTSASPGSPSTRSLSGPESSPPTSGLCEAISSSSLPTPTQQPFIARRHIELGVTSGGSPENGEGALLAITPPAVKRRRGRPPKKNRSPADVGRGVDEASSSTLKGKTNGANPVLGAETLIVAEPVLGPQLIPGPQPLGPQPDHRPEPIILSPVEKRRRGRPPKARDLTVPGNISSPGDGNLESRTQPLPLPPPLPPLPPLLACPTTTVTNTVTTVTISTSPPKRKRGRPPKNPPSPRPSQLPVLDRDSSSVLESCGLGRRRQPLGQGESEGSSSDDDGSRPLTRLARLRLEAEGIRGRKSEGSMVVAVIQDDLDLADSGPGGLELTPPMVSLAPKLRSTRLRPGSLVPPLETEKVPRKRSGALLGGGPGPAKRSRLQPPSPLGPEGSVEESEAEASGEEEEADGTPRRRLGPRRLVGTTNQGDQRILRSSAPPHLSGPTISHRGRKAKT